MGSLVPTVAVALGATVVEKHFILNRNIGGPDSGFSMNKEEFAQMVKDIRDAESSLGSPSFCLTERVKKSRKSGRSLYVASPINAGEIITADNVRCVRPGLSMHPRHWSEIIGRNVKRDLDLGDRLSFDDVE